ncbi:MAG: hypothetical protein NTY45_03475 [Elusimicrobia bacterium]|nr:hypothetical protein [Elusimicrobiota bacterium]
MSVYAVALKDPAAPPLAAAGFLAGTGEYNKDSAREYLRRQPGFLGRRLTLEAAVELRAQAAAAGLEAMLLDEAAVPVPPPPLSPVKIEFKGSGFYFTTSAAVEFVPYEAVTVLAAGAYDAPVEPLNLAALKASVFMKIRDSVLGTPEMSTAARAPLETFFRADIVAGDGRLRLLLEPEKLDFSPLGAERGQASLANFRTLLGKLAAPAFGAAKNAFLRAFLAGEPLALLKLASPEACDLELARLLAAR